MGVCFMRWNSFQAFPNPTDAADHSSSFCNFFSSTALSSSLFPAVHTLLLLEDPVLSGQNLMWSVMESVILSMSSQWRALSSVLLYDWERIDGVPMGGKLYAWFASKTARWKTKEGLINLSLTVCLTSLPWTAHCTDR